MDCISRNRLLILATAVFILVSGLSADRVYAQNGNSPNYSTGSSRTGGNLCDRCQKPLLGGHIKADGYRFHPDCFLCSRCGKPITGSFQHKDKDFYHPDCYKKTMGLVCARCGKLLGDKWQVLGDQKFHAACLKEHLQQTRLKCDICGKPITSKYTKDQSRNYHIDCFRNFKLHKCVVCQRPIEGRMMIDPWGNQAHEKHGDNRTIACSSCMRIISNKTSKGGYRYTDGRTICGFCRPTVVEKSDEVMKSRNTVLAVLHSIGITDIPTTIPVHVVDMEHLKQYSKSRHTPNSKGFTTCMVSYRNDRTVSRKQSIYILNGLPLSEFNGVLAHEIMHVWLNEKDIKLTDPETEGFCNLGTMKVYQEDGSKFAMILLENMEKDSDPLYGDGYRDMKKKVQMMGWDKLIQHIQNR
ncbi:MAG: protein DA1 [Desulfobacteraceae bacterium]|nr:MAG: protein DA1 [Desulfobacteraceae bacterium]